VRVERAGTVFTSRAREGQVLAIPIKHGEGAYFATPEVLAGLAERGQIFLRYCDAEGSAGDAANPNGSIDNIAGVMNERGNVFGLMPHPEHAVEERIGGVDGRVLLGSLVDAIAGGGQGR
jgi:phosphoribosylformylglycinamidine synthase